MNRKQYKTDKMYVKGKSGNNKKEKIMYPFGTKRGRTASERKKEDIYGSRF